jgi:hypothetical protein
MTAPEIRRKSQELAVVRAEVERQRDVPRVPETDELLIISLEERASQLELELSEDELRRVREDVLLTLDVVQGLSQLSGVRVTIDGVASSAANGDAARLLCEERDRLVVLRRRERELATQLYG